jgi:hypothetical protein
MPNNIVDVHVNDDGTVTCDPDILETGKSWRKFRVYWRMITPGWEICGIYAPGGDPLDPDVFYDGKPNGRGWRMKDKNPAPGEYAYEVCVRRVGSEQSIRHDPAIRNGGRK